MDNVIGAGAGVAMFGGGNTSIRCNRKCVVADLLKCMQKKAKRAVGGYYDARND